MVWQHWAYTTWVTNWLDPDRIAVRLLLLVLAVFSLVMSAAIPTAFSRSGLIVGCIDSTVGTVPRQIVTAPGRLAPRL